MSAPLPLLQLLLVLVWVAAAPAAAAAFYSTGGTSGNLIVPPGSSPIEIQTAQVDGNILLSTMPVDAIVLIADTTARSILFPSVVDAGAVVVLRNVSLSGASSGLLLQDFHGNLTVIGGSLSSSQQFVGIGGSVNGGVFNFTDVTAGSTIGNYGIYFEGAVVNMALHVSGCELNSNVAFKVPVTGSSITVHDTRITTPGFAVLFMGNGGTVHRTRVELVNATVAGSGVVSTGDVAHEVTLTARGGTAVCSGSCYALFGHVTASSVLLTDTTLTAANSAVRTTGHFNASALTAVGGAWHATSLLPTVHMDALWAASTVALRGVNASGAINLKCASVMGGSAVLVEHATLTSSGNHNLEIAGSDAAVLLQHSTFGAIYAVFATSAAVANVSVDARNVTALAERVLSVAHAASRCSFAVADCVLPTSPTVLYLVHTAGVLVDSAIALSGIHNDPASIVRNAVFATQALTNTAVRLSNMTLWSSTGLVRLTAVARSALVIDGVVSVATFMYALWFVSAVSDSTIVVRASNISATQRGAFFASTLVNTSLAFSRVIFARPLLQALRVEGDVTGCASSEFKGYES
jgi:hypothetical protein